MNAKTLIVQHISKAFYRKEALSDVSLEARAGEIFGLLGPNGAGKTTLLRIVNGIIEPDRGVVRIGGELMTQKTLRYIGYMPEERGLYQSMSVQEHVLFLGKLRGMPTAEVKKNFQHYLDKWDIQEWKNKRIEELSKGMAQKIQFICSVVHNPDVLFLDEPYSGFDPLNIDLIGKELVEMRKNGKTIVLSTHNMKNVEEICDRIALIHQSKKIFEGSVQELQREKKNNLYQIRFRGNTILFSTILWTGFEIVSLINLSEDRFEATIQLRRTHTFSDLLQRLVGKIEIESAREVLPSMQDIFIDMVQEKKD